MALCNAFSLDADVKHVISKNNQGAVQLDGTRGTLWLPSYLRRDATALGLLLLSMLDITSSFLRMAIDCNPPSSDGSMA